ncbi:hypothetical protein C240_3023 [Enterococcus sp. 5H]|nr:hypothetical protein [Enterococcus sp. 5H]
MYALIFTPPFYHSFIKKMLFFVQIKFVLLFFYSYYNIDNKK